MGTVLGSSLSQIGSKLIELLSSALQGNPQGRHPSSMRRLPHQRSEQIVSKYLHPNFFTNHLGCFSQNYLHLQRGFEVQEN